MTGTDPLLGIPNVAIPVTPPPGVRSVDHIRLDPPDAEFARDTEAIAVLVILLLATPVSSRWHGGSPSRSG